MNLEKGTCCPSQVEKYFPSYGKLVFHRWCPIRTSPSFPEASIFHKPVSSWGSPVWKAISCLSEPFGIRIARVGDSHLSSTANCE